MRLAKGIKRRVPGQMNRLESAWCEQIRLRQHAGEIAWWKFEGIALKLADDTRYTPDFSVMLEDGTIEFHECKGFMRDDAWVKLKVAAEQYPLFRFVLVTCKKGVWTVKQIRKDGAE